jgi:uncharacterized OB-fold protein
MKSNPREGLPSPELDERNQPLVQNAAQNVFVLPVCADCGAIMAPPVANCTRCLSDAIEWRPSSGTGTVFSFIDYHRAWVKEFESLIPYNVSIIELDEGPRMISNVLTDGSQAVKIGARVRVAFETRAEGRAVPVFVLDDRSASEDT